VRCFVVAGFLLTSTSRGPSAIAELLVIQYRSVTDTQTHDAAYAALCSKNDIAKANDVCGAQLAVGHDLVQPCLDVRQRPRHVMTEFPGCNQLIAVRRWRSAG